MSSPLFIEIYEKQSIATGIFFRSMKDTLCAQMFTFDQSFQPYQKDEFVLVSRVLYTDQK